MLFDETFAFVRVVEAGSFTAAGRNLGAPKSTLSRQVMRLEEELGALLLVRSTRKLTLTDTGRAYFERCRDALSTLEEASRAAANEGKTPEGHVRVACSFDMASEYITPLLAEFRKLYPKVSLALILSQGRADLIAERIDVAFRGGELDDSSFVCRKIVESRMIFCAAPSYLEREGHPKSVEELIERETVMIGPDGNALRLPFEGPDGPIKLELSPWLISNEFSTLAQVLVDGAGIGPMIDVTAGPYIERGQLRRVLPDYSLSGGGLYVVYPSRHHLSPKVRVFVDFVIDRLGPRLEMQRALAMQC